MSRLRVGVLLAGGSTPLWVRRMLEKIQVLPQVGIEAVLLFPENQVTNPLFSRYFKLDQRIFHPGSAPWQAASLPDLPLLHGSMGEHLVQLGSLQLDVLINLALMDPPVGLASLARSGAWTLRDGRSRLIIGSQPGWRELLENEPLTVCELEILRKEPPAQIFARAVLATDSQSVSRNQLRLLWHASSLIPRTLQELALRGEKDFFAGGESAPPGMKSFPPTVGQLGLLGVKQAVHKLSDTVRKRFTVDQWMPMSAPLAAGEPLGWRRFTTIRLPRDRSWADPFIIERDDRRYVFLEEYPLATKRGHISCLTLDENGKVASCTPVLEQPYHLSYPFVFERWGEWYMIPETGGNRTVELYRCTRFPDEWAFEKILLKDIHAVDATLLEHGGRWWMFANVAEEEGSSAWDSLHLFYSDDPLSDNWIPHPLNPVVSDVRSARPAGRIFLRDGMLYRPSQVSVPRYGYALRLNRIDRLTSMEYAETSVETLVPPRGRNILATHTFNTSGGLAVIDVQSRRIRLS